MSGSRGSSYLSSPDEPSKVFPERLIRPLPKYSIRSRLSQEAADSISFPPNPPSTNFPTYGQYDYEHEHDSYQEDDDHDHDCPHHHHHHCHHDHEHDDDVDSADDASLVVHAESLSSRASPLPSRLGRHGRHDGHMTKALVLDSYEAFENTNNKKKRKIPTSGIQHPSLSSEFGQMGINGSKDGAADDSVQSFYPSPSQSGGRSRAARKTSMRNALSASANGTSTRPGQMKIETNGVTSKGEETKADQGIISAAIANATALLRNPLGKAHGQENIGVLDQQAKSTPTHSQFTFTCESEAKGVKFPEQSLYSPDYSQRISAASSLPPMTPNHKHPSQGTQTSPHTNAVSQQISSSQQAGIGGVPNSAPGQNQKPRRRKGDVYALAARQRKLQQEYANLQHPPAPEDVWICEFCEYESIFGAPPYALIRQYELKDRREKKRLAEKRRLLEKAKLKGRKAKKQTKNAAKSANNVIQSPLNQPGYDQQQLDSTADDYLDDGYDDDPLPIPGPPPEAPTKHPMPGAYNTGAGSATAGPGGGGGGGIR